MAETLVELADTTAIEFDLDVFLRMLANRCVRLLDVDAAGALVIDHGVAASNEPVALLELSAMRNEEGPGPDCGRDGRPVVVPDLAAAEGRWPRFTSAARGAGYSATHTIPLRRRTQVIGALTLFRTDPGEVPTPDVRSATAMADVATIGILAAKAVRTQRDLVAQLQYALDSRVIIEQAKGVLAERLGLTMSAAFSSLRAYARSHNTKVSVLATSIVDGGFDTSRLRR
jgi:GAF domain-containing protein